MNFSGVAGRGGAGGGESRGHSQIIQLYWQHDSQSAKTKDSAYVAQERSRCCLRCTQRDTWSSSSGKRPPGAGAGTARTSTQQPKWTLWCHRPLTLGQAGSCIPGSAR